jgi:hypothetical protein
MFIARLLVMLAALLAGPALAAIIVATPETLQRQLETAAAGDIIRLGSGDYPSIRLRDRTWVQVVTVEAGEARITSVVLRNIVGLTWRGGIFDGQNVLPNGIKVENGQLIQIENTRMSRYLRNGIGFSEVSDSRLVGNSFRDMGSDGIDIALSRRIVIDRTSCQDFKRTPGAHSDCIQLWSRPTAAPTADIHVSNTVAAGDMQGVTAFNHVRNGVDDGGFDRIVFANNDIRITFAQAVSLYDCRNCIARDNYIDTWPGAHNRARLVVQGQSDVAQCGNVVKLFPKLPGQLKCTGPLLLPLPPLTP